MSEMRDLMLRSLDRIVADTLQVREREAADASGAWPDTLWQALRDQGMTGIGDGSESDLGFADVMALVQRSAFHAVPAPLAETALARRLLARSGIEAPDGAITVVAPAAMDGVKLTGNTLTGEAVVPWARHVPSVVLAAGDRLVLADVAGAAGRLGANIAGEPRDAVDLAQAKIVGSAALPRAGSVVEAEGALLRAVQMSGALSRVLEHALTWVNDRVQFGRPIAKFQAIQHLMAQLAAETAAASAAADLAVEASVTRVDPLLVAIAKARIGEAAGKGAAIAHQVFGAMGFTREHPLHYATRRLWSWRDEFGGEAYWQGEIGRTVAANGADNLWATLTERG